MWFQCWLAVFKHCITGTYHHGNPPFFIDGAAFLPFFAAFVKEHHPGAQHEPPQRHYCHQCTLTQRRCNFISESCQLDKLPTWRTRGLQFITFASFPDAFHVHTCFTVSRTRQKCSGVDLGCSFKGHAAGGKVHHCSFKPLEALSGQRENI